MIDLHVHILPGLDDGPKTLDEAVEMCRMAQEDGTTVLVAAPHMFNGRFDVTRRDIVTGIDLLVSAIEEGGLAVRIIPAAELGLSDDLGRLIRDGEVVTLAERGRHVLVELGPYDTMPAAMRILHEIQLAGLTPILAHPERNLEIQKNPETLLPAILADNLVQCTAGSLLGDFGPTAKRCVSELLRRHMVHVFASDAHSASARRPVLSQARTVVQRLYDEGTASLLFDKNPRKLIEGKPAEVPPPLEKPVGRLRGLLTTWLKT